MAKEGISQRKHLDSQYAVQYYGKLPNCAGRTEKLHQGKKVATYPVKDWA